MKWKSLSWIIISGFMDKIIFVSNYEEKMLICWIMSLQIHWLHHVPNVNELWRWSFRFSRRLEGIQWQIFNIWEWFLLNWFLNWSISKSCFFWACDRNMLRSQRVWVWTEIDLKKSKNPYQDDKFWKHNFDRIDQEDCKEPLWVVLASLLWRSEVLNWKVPFALKGKMSA